MQAGPINPILLMLYNPSMIYHIHTKDNPMQQREFIFSLLYLFHWISDSKLFIIDTRTSMQKKQWIGWIEQAHSTSMQKLLIILKNKDRRKHNRLRAKSQFHDIALFSFPTLIFANENIHSLIPESNFLASAQIGTLKNIILSD